MPLNFPRAAFSLSFLLVALTVQGQVMPNATPDVTLSARDSRAVVLGPGEAPKLIAFTLDSTSNGVFSVFATKPEVVISLITPGGTQVDNSNADALGFRYQKVLEGSPFVPGDPDAPGPGATTLISLPADAPTGIYQWWSTARP